MNGKILVVISAFTALVLLFFIACSAVDLPVIQPRLENATVSPPSSETWNRTFNYTVNCTFSKVVNITLEVYNLSLHDWRPVGDKTYNNTGKPQLLNWSSKICSGECEGTSSYRFKYNETVLETRTGPRISFIPEELQEEFKNATVYPASGHFNDSFSCIVWVNLSVRHDINLEVLDIARYISGVGYKWKRVGNKTYNPGDWQKLPFTWNDTDNIFENDCAGLASYRFYYIDESNKRHESDLFYGPELISYNETKIIEKYYYGGGGGGGGHVSKSRLKKVVKEILEEEQLEEWKRQIGRSDIPLSKPNITCNVTPEIGRWFKPFKYNATIKNPDRANISLGLFVYKPGSDMWELVKYKPYRSNALILKNTTKLYNDKNITYIEWDSIGIFDVSDVNKNTDYQYFIWYYDGYNEEEVYFTGPENVTDNHEPVVIGSLTPTNGSTHGTYIYKAEISDPDKDDAVFISLYVNDPLYPLNESDPIPMGMKKIEIREGTGNVTWEVSPASGVFSWEKLVRYINETGNASFCSSFYQRLFIS